MAYLLGSDVVAARAPPRPLWSKIRAVVVVVGTGHRSGLSWPSWRGGALPATRGHEEPPTISHVAGSGRGRAEFAMGLELGKEDGI